MAKGNLNKTEKMRPKLLQYESLKSFGRLSTKIQISLHQIVKKGFLYIHIDFGHAKGQLLSKKIFDV